MKSDRRTLTVVAVFLAFVFLVPQFRGFFLFGSHLFSSGLTLQDTIGVVPRTPTDTFNVGVWSLTPPPDRSGASRDEQLGLILVQMSRNWNTIEGQSKDPSIPLEEFCRANPEDIAAKAHLARLTLNLPSLEKVKDKTRLTALAQRVLVETTLGAAKEPSNWYWRERLFHLLCLLGENDKAANTWTAKPYPTTFDDHVFDEITCKEALYHGQYFNLPRSAMYPIWGGIIFPHLSTGEHLKKFIKSRKDSVQLRVGEIELGRAMIKSCPTTIAAMVGIRHIRLGIWNTNPKIANTWQDYSDAKNQQEVEQPYQQAVSKVDWDYCLRVAKSDVVPRFLQPDENIAGLMIGQFGPFFIYTGISCALIGVGFLLLNRTKLKNLGREHLVWPVLLVIVATSDIPFVAHMTFLAIAIGLFFLIRCRLHKLTYENLAWPTLLLALTFVGASWKDWGYFAEASLANQWLFFLLLPLSIWAIVMASKFEKGKRLLPILLILSALSLGYAYRTWQATSLILVLLFLMQKGNPQLKPWPIAITMLLTGYHFAISQGLHPGMNEVPLGFFSVLVVQFLMAKRDPDPDQPRLALVTVGLGAAILGTFLIAQYDNGFTTAMESDLKQIDKVRAKYANL